MYLVMELCERGELADILKDKDHLPEDDVKTVMKKLASAISYLHKNDIVHRDLKLENILVGRNPEDPTDTFHIKVTDFGLSVVKDGPGHESMMQAFCGTPMYMSPEIIDNKSYSQQCDVWAMGVIAFMLLVGSPPFKSKDEDSLYELIKKGDMDFTSPLWETISKGAKDCICGMLTVDPAHRLTASEVADHSWISGQEGQGRTNVLEMMKQFRLNQDIDDEESAINGGVADGEVEKPNSAGGESSRRASAGNDSKNKTKVSLSKTTRSPGLQIPNSTLPVQRTPKSGMKHTSPSAKSPMASKSPNSNRQSAAANRSPVSSGKFSAGTRTSQTPIKPPISNNNNTPKIKKTEKKV